MLLTILLAALQTAQGAAAPAPEAEMRPLVRGVLDPVTKCPESNLRNAQEDLPTRARRLIELPPGRLELAVMRYVAGCPIPAVLREGIGGRPQGPEGQSGRR